MASIIKSDVRQLEFVLLPEVGTIRLVLEDFIVGAQHHGNVTIIAGGLAWAATIRDKGDYSLEHLIATSGADYLQSMLLADAAFIRRPDYYERKSLMRIITEIQRALHGELKG